MTEFKFFNKQEIFIEHILSGRYLYLLFGGGVSGGKTMTALPVAYKLLIDYPGIRVGLLRKNLTTIRRNTVPSIQKTLDIFKDKTQLNKSEWTYTFANGSQLVLVEADESKDPELNKLKGLELTVLLIEEANEISQKAFGIAVTRIGRWLNNKGNKYEEIPPLVLMTCNPDDGWIKEMFYDKWVDGKIPYSQQYLDNLKAGKIKEQTPYCFVQSLPNDNPHNSEAYLKSLENLPEEIYQQYVKGNWEYSSEPNRIHKYSDLRSAITPLDELAIPKYLGIDAGRDGDDPTILTFGDDSGILWSEIYPRNKNNEAVEAIIHHIDHLGLMPHNIACDSIGNGAGIINPLHMAGYKIKEFCASETPSGKTDLKFFKFKNKRIEAAWLLAEDIKNGYTISNHTSMDNFIKEASIVKYKVDDKFIVMEKKDDIKARLGHSPDYYDSAKIMNYVRHGLLGGNFTFNYINTKSDKKYISPVRELVY